jgi:hypothetical protein
VELNVVGLGLFQNTIHDLGTLLVEQRLANL